MLCAVRNIYVTRCRNSWRHEQYRGEKRCRGEQRYKWEGHKLPNIILSLSVPFFFFSPLSHSGREDVSQPCISPSSFVPHRRNGCLLAAMAEVTHLDLEPPYTQCVQCPWNWHCTLCTGQKLRLPSWYKSHWCIFVVWHQTVDLGHNRTWSHKLAKHPSSHELAGSILQPQE